MAHDREARRIRGIGRLEAIALFGLLVGMASAALLTQFAERPAEKIRATI